MIYEVLRADLPGDVVVPEDIVLAQRVLAQQPPPEPFRRGDRPAGEDPALIRVTELDADNAPVRRTPVPVRGEATESVLRKTGVFPGPDVIGHLVPGKHLEDLSVHPDDRVSRSVAIGLAVVHILECEQLEVAGSDIIFLSRRTGPMVDDRESVETPLPRARERIDRQQSFGDFH